MARLLDEAADALERRIFFDQFSTRYAELRDDPEEWREIEGERGAERSALRDRST